MRQRFTWQHRYSADLKSSAARTAMQTMHAHQRAQVRHFYRSHHLSVTLSVTTSRMRYGAGGWMGLGGMWGGWGW